MTSTAVAGFMDDVLFGQVWQSGALPRGAQPGDGRQPDHGREHRAARLSPRPGEGEGATDGELIEVITDLAFYAGWPKAMSPWPWRGSPPPRLKASWPEPANREGNLHGIRNVGSTGVRVLPLCLGTMSFGSEADEQVRCRCSSRREAGIYFFDTADVDGQGASEETRQTGRRLPRLGRHRHQGLLLDRPGSQRAGLSRRHIVRWVEASLERLGTEWVDVDFVDAFDEATPVEQTLSALDVLRRQGRDPLPGGEQLAGRGRSPRR